MVSLAIPFGKRTDWEDGIQFNPQIGKDERNALFTVLPDVHAAAIDILVALIERFDRATLPFAHTLVEDIISLFEAEKDIPLIRTSIYAALTALLPIVGPSLPKTTVASLSPCLRSSCRDLLPTAEKPRQATSLEKGQATTSVAPNTAQTTTKAPETQYTALTSSATQLMTAYMTHTPAPFIPLKVRADIERVAIFLDIKPILQAAVLNPVQKNARQGASLLPILARLHPDDADLEGLLRPRMPVIRSRARDDIAQLDDEAMDDDVEEEEDEDEDEDEEEKEAEDAAAEQETAEMEIEKQLIDDEALAAQHSTPSISLPPHPHPNQQPAPGPTLPVSSTFPPPAPKRPASPPTTTSTQTKRTRLSSTSTNTLIAATPTIAPDPAGSSTDTVISGSIPATASASAPASAPADNDTDEDDDYGELVMGRDTDEDEDEGEDEEDA